MYTYVKEECVFLMKSRRLRGSTTGVTGLCIYIYNIRMCIWCGVYNTAPVAHITSTQISTAGPRFIVLVKQIGSARMFYVIVRNAAEISPITIIITIELHKLQKKKY